MYTPTFKCPHCGSEKPAKLYGETQGLVVPCDCEDAKDAWERAHRAEMERRKRSRRK